MRTITIGLLAVALLLGYAGSANAAAVVADATPPADELPGPGRAL